MRKIKTDRYDRYWRQQNVTRLDNSQLRAEIRAYGWAAEGDMKRIALLQLLRKIRSGVALYEKCTKEELEHSIEARHLTKPSTRVTPAKATLLRKLKTADLERAFDKFLDLPAELRRQVYDHYLAEFPEILTAPTKPPLARTCTQIRHEVLPVFYQSQYMKINMRYSPKDSRVKFDSYSSLFLHTNSAMNLANVRRLSFCNYIFVSMAGVGPKYNVTFKWLDCMFYPRDTDQEIELVKSLTVALHEVLDRVMGREKRLQLTLDDVYAMVRAVERGHREASTFATTF